MTGKIILIITLLILSCTKIVLGQEYYSGKIIFEDNRTQKFFSISYFSGTHLDNAPLNSKFEKNGSYQLRVKFNNAYRDVSMKDIYFIEIIRYKAEKNNLKNVLVYIETKTGVTFENELGDLSALVGVKILDELSGELSTISNIGFGDLGKLNIRKIIFD